MGQPLPSLDFSAAPDNLLTEAAWQAITGLLAPLPPEVADLGVLRTIYLPRIQGILEAADWVEKPKPTVDCSQDLDLDGTPECILASSEYFALIDPAGGRLVYLFGRAEDGAHQMIAPSSQFIVGLGDPISWDLAAGESAETQGIHGAFSDSPGAWQNYQTRVTEDAVFLSTADGARVKIFTLTAGGLRVEYLTSDSLTTRIPIALDPWIRFTQGWDRGYQSVVGQQTLTWGLESGGYVRLSTSARLRFDPFTASQAQINAPEDPNFDYPAGHYLPFPLAVAEINASGDFNVIIAYNTP